MSTRQDRTHRTAEVRRHRAAVSRSAKPSFRLVSWSNSFCASPLKGLHQTAPDDKMSDRQERPCIYIVADCNSHIQMIMFCCKQTEICCKLNYTEECQDYSSVWFICTGPQGAGVISNGHWARGGVQPWSGLQSITETQPDKQPLTLTPRDSSELIPNMNVLVCGRKLVPVKTHTCKFQRKRLRRELFCSEATAASTAPLRCL